MLQYTCNDLVREGDLERFRRVPGISAYSTAGTQNRAMLDYSTGVGRPLTAPPAGPGAQRRDRKAMITSSFRG